MNVNDVQVIKSFLLSDHVTIKGSEFGLMLSMVKTLEEEQVRLTTQQAQSRLRPVPVPSSLVAAD